MPPRRSLPPVDIVTIHRDQFLSYYWAYSPGDMVTVLAPYGGGKTVLAFQLLQATATPELPAVVLVMKPKDKEVSRWTRAMKLLVVRDWPPSRLRRLVLREKRPGWVLWPGETDDPDADDRRHAAIFRRCLRERYRSAGRAKGKPCIVFADETYSLEHEMKLTRDLVRIWTKGRSVGCGLFAASQRPVWISRWALQAHHLFLGYDPDRQMQQRYGEIGGGIDPDVVRDAVARLKEFQFLYLNRQERTMAIIDAS
jgi:hypothetical protein